jgi:uncharacterized protein
LRNLMCLLIGLLFGIGLCISGMTRPEKVLGFLDLAGPWDPSLALVMGGAVLVGLVAFRIAKTRRSDLLGGPMELPTASAIDAPLICGSVIFGIGWGLVGLCPGPAIVDVGYFEPRALFFVAAMAAGMAIHEAARLRRPARQAIEQDA